MWFKDSEFNNGYPHNQGAKFEGCTFNITDPKDTNQLPPAWRCIDCVAILDGNKYTFGRSSN
jgi:hypothetical protein